MLSYRMTADDVMKQDPELAIIPVGSLEQHGPHLPIMTDWAIATELGKRVAEKLNAFLVPALPVSTCREQMGKKGSVWMEPTTFYQMMSDIILSLKTQGFKKVAILQCHGGVFILTPLVRDLNARYNPELMVVNVSTDVYGPILVKEGILETPELHAGEGETSNILCIDPQAVHMDRAVDFVPDVPRPYLSYGSIFRASPTGVWGEPTHASAEKGARALERMTEIAVDEIDRAFDYMEKKEKFNYSWF
ncbi:MAG: creatininase family protein [Oscillospiraceae bacterium]|nr:creatininase family protein [Oscillospiraceae bacterium]